MSTQTTKEQAIEVLHLLTAEHGGRDYFKRADVVSADIGWGVDIWVDREKWEAAKIEAKTHTSLISVAIDRVPICVLVVG